MILLLLVVRLILAAVFLVSAVAKLLDREGSRRAARDFGVPAHLSGLVAAGLPIAELLCAGLLVSGDPGASAGAVLSIVLLGSFTIVIVIHLLRGRRPNCHCFGQLSSAPTGWPTVVRNGALLVLALLPLGATGDLPSVPAQLADYSAADLTLGLVIGGLVAAVVVLGTLFRTIMGRYGDVLVRLETLESSFGSAFEPQPAPLFQLPDLDGRQVGLADVIAQQRPVLLVFISPDCTICADLLPDLHLWQTTEHATAVLVVSTGSVSSNRDKLTGVPGLRVLLQFQREVEEAYGLQGTPGAFLLGVDGMIAMPAAYGTDAIRQMHQSVLAAMVPGEVDHDHGPSSPVAPAVQVGDPVPALPVLTEAGTTVDLADLTDEEAVLLFWDATCGYCAEIVDDVAELANRTRVLIVGRGNPAEIRASGLTSPVISDPSSGVESALRIPGTPAAVVVRDRAVGSEVAVGGPEVLALLAA